MLSKVVDFLGYPLYTGNLELVEWDNLKVINTINPYSYYCACFDQKFSTALKASDLMFPDGVGIILGANILGIKGISRITGSDIHLAMLRKLNARRGRVFYMGASDEALEKIKARLSIEFPELTVDFHSPPFRDEFDDSESNEIIDIINAFEPDMLFVGMTAPKQEKWVYDHADKIMAKQIVAVGAVFDFYSGTVTRPGEFWIRLGLEWFRRLMGEPRRMWKRNFIATPFFLWHVIKAAIKQRFGHKSAV